MGEYAAAGNLVGGGLTAIGQINEGYDRAYVASVNKETALDNARRTREKALEDERRQRRFSYQVLGDIRSSYAASGIDSTQGSAMDILHMSAEAAERDALMIRYRGQDEA